MADLVSWMPCRDNELTRQGLLSHPMLCSFASEISSRTLARCCPCCGVWEGCRRPAGLGVTLPKRSSCGSCPCRAWPGTGADGGGGELAGPGAANGSSCLALPAGSAASGPHCRPSPGIPLRLPSLCRKPGRTAAGLWLRPLPWGGRGRKRGLRVDVRTREIPAAPSASLLRPRRPPAPGWGGFGGDVWTRAESVWVLGSLLCFSGCAGHVQAPHAQPGVPLLPPVHVWTGRREPLLLPGLCGAGSPVPRGSGADPLRGRHRPGSAGTGGTLHPSGRP